MNSYFSKMLVVLCLLAGIRGMTAKAQIESDVTIEADIPHA
ncbi:MAG TPA: hypothetical protein VNO70_08265 [Blastocatellia bacterium]|nr:hypothetical protein [Blastocatellia bacterium]